MNAGRVLRILTTLAVAACLALTLYVIVYQASPASIELRQPGVYVSRNLETSYLESTIALMLALLSFFLAWGGVFDRGGASDGGHGGTDAS